MRIEVWGDHIGVIAVCFHDAREYYKGGEVMVHLVLRNTGLPSPS